MLPCRYSRVQVRRFTAALLPHTHTHSKTSRRRRFCLEPSAVVVGRSVMLRGEAGVRRSWPAASRSLDFVCVWTVAVAVVDQVVFWRLASASGCRAGPVATVRKRRRRVPFSGKICRRRAWHRGERWVDGGAAFLWLGLSCPFSLLCWSCWTETPPEGPGPPRRGPVVNGGDEANPRAKVSAGICCQGIDVGVFQPCVRPLFSDIQRRPLSACLSACGLSMCTGGRHPRRPHPPCRASPQTGSCFGAFYRTLPRCGFSLLMHMAREKTNHQQRRPALPPSKKRGIAEAMPKWWWWSPVPACCCELSLLRPRQGMRPAVSPIPSRRQAGLGWAGCGVFAGAPGCGGRNRTHNPQPVFQCVKSRKQAQQQANIPNKLRRLLGVAISPPLKPLALHLPPLPLLISCAAGEQEKHYPTLLHTAEAVMVRSSEGDFEKGAV